MVTSPLTHDQPDFYGIAKRLRPNKECAPNTVVMTTVVCEQCGAQFTIGHRPALQDAPLAKKQAAWLKDQFVWDHIQENKHAGSLRLPGSHDMK